MTIPFLSYFKRGKGADLAVKRPDLVSKPALQPLEKPSSERFKKTVMPNATRTVAPQDPFHMAARSSATANPSPAPAAVAPASSVARTIAFAAPAAPSRPRDLPPAVALALEPQVERVIALDLADIAAQMPAGYLKPSENIDLTGRILLNASEVERGMASGKPTVSLWSIYQQMPEIFERDVAPGDASQVSLPFTKVLEQFTKLQVRNDQERPQSVPQVETPFLKVTLEDNSRFGTTTEPLQTADFPPVRVEPPTAEAFAAAEPEPLAPEKSNVSSRNGAAPKLAEGNAPSAPTRIPFRLVPNGTDAPAPECVPASAGPSVPTSLASAPAPTRIPFKMTAPCDDLRPRAESTPLPPERPVILPAAKADIKISLALKPILQGLPPFQLNGDITIVPAETQIQLPFSLIEPQLAVGRITIAPNIFEAGLPPEYRNLFNAGDARLEVALPLQEVLKNLPSTSLRMRDDQEEQEAGQNFATPFSAKAEEDAKRFNVASAPVSKPLPATVPSSETPGATVPSDAASRPLRTPLQVALDTDDKLDAKGIVERINKISGVKACAFMFGDGLNLAGSLPAEYETDGLCAMAPSLLQRVENHMVETKLGALRGVTLSCAKAAVTFFMHENLCLAALHANVELATEVRERLSRVVHELSRKYSNPV